MFNWESCLKHITYSHYKVLADHCPDQPRWWSIQGLDSKPLINNQHLSSSNNSTLFPQLPNVSVVLKKKEEDRNHQFNKLKIPLRRTPIKKEHKLKKSYMSGKKTHKCNSTK